MPFGIRVKDAVVGDMIHMIPFLILGLALLFMPFFIIKSKKKSYIDIVYRK